MKYMDEWFLTLECGQDFIEYWFYIDKELYLYEDIFFLCGFVNFSVIFVLVKDFFCFFFFSRFWKFFYEI